MIFEMTLDYDVVLPLMLACVTAHFTAKAYRRGRSVYHESLQPERDDVEPDWRLRTIEALVKPAAAVMTEDITVQQMLNELPKRPAQTIYVVDADRQLLAALDPREVLARLRRGEIEPDSRIAQVTPPIRFVLTPNMSLATALDGFLRQQVKTLPVTSGHWNTTLLGEVSRHDLLLALQDRIAGRG
jgi:CIC family chloride channel protein